MDPHPSQQHAGLHRAVWRLHKFFSSINFLYTFLNVSNPAYFCLFSFFPHEKYSKNTINDKSIDGVLWTQTRGSRMESADESTVAMAAPKIKFTFEFWRETVLGVGSKSGPISLSRSSCRVLDPRLAELRLGWWRATGRFIFAAVVVVSFERKIRGLWSRETWPETEVGIRFSMEI